LELPRRSKGDEYTRPGRYGELQSRLHRRLAGRDIPVLFVYAFDYRTRLGPFLFCDKMLVPGAPTAVGAALHAAGFTNTRLVLQQWTPNVRPSRSRLDGRLPEVLLISSMQIHSAAAYELIRDAWTLDDNRPLILAGGPKAIYEPWDFFGLSDDGAVAADVVVTGEEFVTLELLQRIVEHKADHETMRQAFDRVRLEELLNDIPGLVYRPDRSAGRPSYLIHTGIQRLVQNLDELPLPFDALALFEPRHRGPCLSRRPVPAGRLHRHADGMSVVTTHGCKFRCPYCPIPAYNQFTFRFKSPQRLVEAMAGTRERSGIGRFFSTDDNFFNNRDAAAEILTAMAQAEVGGRRFRDRIEWGTEATEFDVLKNHDLLPLAHDAGLRAIWFGVEDMTAELINKGQSAEKTERLFTLMQAHGIAPMPMLMHHDGQPLRMRRGLYGLLNQTRALRRLGAPSFQVTFLTPAVGTKGFEQPYRDGIVMSRVGGRPVDDYLFDGNHCIATGDPQPWRKQLNLTAAYATFYNPVNLLRAALRFDSLWIYRVLFPLVCNITVVWSLWRDRGWIRRLSAGDIERQSEPPGSKFPLVAPAGVDRN
jgi:radical SAM superfamily enzyme YgiQ (UPF0313 family)